MEEADGTEMNYAKIYAEKHGMKMELVVNAEELWGDIYDNWTGNGILGEVVMDKSDFGIGINLLLATNNISIPKYYFSRNLPMGNCI